MKTAGRFLLIALVVYCLVSCSKSKETTTPAVTSLAGQWKEVQRYVSPGGSTTWQKVSGPLLTIHDDSSYTSEPAHFALGTKGRFFRVNDSTLIVKDSDGQTGSFLHFKQINSNAFELWFGCIEGCASRFLKPNAPALPL